MKYKRSGAVIDANLRDTAADRKSSICLTSITWAYRIPQDTECQVTDVWRSLPAFPSRDSEHL